MNFNCVFFSFTAHINPIQTIDLVMSRQDEEAQKANLNGSTTRSYNVNDDMYYDGPKAYVFYTI